LEGLLGAANIATRIYGMKQQAGLDKDRIDLMQEDQRLRARGIKNEEDKTNALYGSEQVDLDTGQVARTGGLENRKMSVMETQARTDKNKLPAYQQQFTLAETNIIKMGLADKGLDKVMKPFTDRLDQMAKDEQYTKGYTYQTLKENWMSYKNMLIKSFASKIQKIDDPEEKKRLTQLMIELGQDDEGVLLDMAMPQTARALQLEKMEAVGKLKTEPLSTLGKLTREFNSLPEDSPMRDVYQQRMEKEVQSTGEQISIETDASGRPIVTITKGSIGKTPGGMSVRTQGTIEDNLIQAGERMARLKNVKKSFDKDFLNIGKRLKFAMTGWRQKFEGTPVGSIIGKATPEDVQEAKRYWKFRQDSVTNLNKEIKWLTGAAMNKTEVPRLSQEVPTAGLGLFDGDAPDEFESKLNNKIKETNLYIVRYGFLLRQGLSPERIKAMGDKNLLPGEAQIRTMMNDRVGELIDSGLDEISALEQVQKELFTFE